MTTPGSLFPVVGAGGEVEWWVVNQVTRPGGPRGPQATNYRVVSTTGGTRPPNAVAGPFTTQQQAVQWQTGANTAGNSPGSAIGGIGSSIANSTGIGAIGDLAHRLTESSTWIRVGEFIAGGLLLYVGAKAFFPTTVNNINTVAKGTVKAASRGLI